MCPTKVALRAELWSPVWQLATFTPASGAPRAGAAAAAVGSASAASSGARVSALTPMPLTEQPGGPRVSARGLGRAPLGGATLEALDPSAGVHQLLTARVER